MMKRKTKRLAIIGGAGVFLAAATALVLVALNQQIVFFVDPTNLLSTEAMADQRVRLGGLVEEGSVEKSDESSVAFRITDQANSVAVIYAGILPDLFREGQGVVTEGKLRADGVFVADTVLAKHDETYMPREVADSLRDRGVWQGDGQ